MDELAQARAKRKERNAKAKEKTKKALHKARVFAARHIAG